ncbi:MAG TPA: threonine ammonia-lyase [Nitrospiria bacterium]|nr:threonine ammonia-lyase [Nitrospiria bacterium]
MVTLRGIQEAYKRLAERVDRTPLVFSHSFSARLGLEIYLKLENLQKTGSFKIRGASHKLSRLTEAERLRGVVAASAGNHAQGVAFAAQEFGLSAVIVMPVTAALAKQQATKGYGAQIILAGHDFDEALLRARTIEKAEGRIFIHAFDDEDIITGQGSIGLELLEQNPDIETVIVPVGGGGLIAGVATAIREQKPGVKMMGVRAASFPTLADGIAVRKHGEITQPLIERYVDDLVSVDEEEIAAAILLLMEQKRIVVEGAGAVPLAALLRYPERVRGKKVGLIISGGNIDVNMLERIIERGLVKTGRLIRLSVELADLPGSLAALTTAVADLQANILHIVHDRLSRDLPITMTRVELSLEIRGPEHGEAILADLRRKGFKAALTR